MKQFLETCRKACHERDACAEGYKDLLAAENLEQIAAVWRKYLPEVVGDMFAEHVLEGLQEHYARIAPQFNKAGIYYNECPPHAPSNTIVIIGPNLSDDIVHVYGNATGYILGHKGVTCEAHNASTVYNRMNDSAAIVLHDGASGKLAKGGAYAKDHSVLYSKSEHTHFCCDSASVFISNGILFDHGHMVIRASGNAVVESATSQKIHLFGNARLQPHNS